MVSDNRKNSLDASEDIKDASFSEKTDAEAPAEVNAEQRRDVSADSGEPAQASSRSTSRASEKSDRKTRTNRKNASRSSRGYRRRSQKKSKASSSTRRNVWLLVLTAVLMIASIAIFMPPSQTINQGLDVQGGLSVVLTAKSTDGTAIDEDTMESSRTIIENRVNALGASEAVVQTQGNNQILVQIPGLQDTEAALNTIGKTGKLEFARLDSFTDESVKSQIEEGSYLTQDSVSDDYGNTFYTGTTTSTLSVPSGTYTPLITGQNINKVTVGRASETSSYYAVNLELDSEGTEAFKEATTDLAPTNGQIVILLDGEVQSAPAVQSVISTGEVSITGNYSETEAKATQTILQSGSLPVSFQYEQSQAVGPTLGQDALRVGVLVAALGLLLVMLYLLYFYRGLGLITAAAMGVFAVLYLGILALLSTFGLFSLSLAGLAGVVLTIGMAADSSILVLERFKEEIRMGRSVRSASISGVRHAILTSIDADLVTLVSALTLFFLASASVKGFGMTLAIGIICDIVMMLIFKAPIIRLLAPKLMSLHGGFWGINESLNAHKEKLKADEEGKILDIAKLKGKFIKRDINFLGYRKVFLIISACLIVVSLGIAGIKGLNFGIEFVGGTSITFTNTGDVTADELRSALNDAGISDPVIQNTESNGTNGFLVRTSQTDAQQAASSAQQVANTFNFDTQNIQVDTIGPDWGASVVRSSAIAFVVSLLLIIAYISVRFRQYKMGVTAVGVLIHDLIIVVGVYALVGREITPNTIAALLTIVGYSLYDTVVVFHRINDNMNEGLPRTTFMTMANHSLNQVLIRSLNTTLTSLIPVLAMLIFGGETLKDFALAMTVGLVCGSYSSIALATPLFSIWKSREPENKKLIRKYGPEVRLFEFGNDVPFLPGQTNKGCSVSVSEVNPSSNGTKETNGAVAVMEAGREGAGSAGVSPVNASPAVQTPQAQTSKPAKNTNVSNKQRPQKKKRKHGR